MAFKVSGFVHIALAALVLASPMTASPAQAEGGLRGLLEEILPFGRSDRPAEPPQASGEGAAP
ncbi:hypothetical protein EJC49_19210, partial [Aquibium carbonis]